MSAAHQAMLMIGAAGLSALAFITSASANSSSGVVCPTVQAGDLLVFWESSNSTTATPADAYPSGFTSISTQVENVQFIRTSLSYKIATGSEGGTTLNGHTAGASDLHGVLVFRAEEAIANVSVLDVNSQVTANAPTDQVVNTSVGPTALVAIAAYYGSTTGFTRGFNPAADGEVQCGAALQFLKYKIVNSGTGPDITVSQSDVSAVNVLMSCYLAVS